MEKPNLDYYLYVQREKFFTHQPKSNEHDFYAMVAAGKVDEIIDNKKKYPNTSDSGKGKLSENPVTNEIYHMIVNTALTARACIDAGMPQEISYTLSDMYIERTAECRTVKEVMALNDEMIMDYASRMKTLLSGSRISFRISKALDYIYRNLHTKISASAVAARIGMSRQYFSVRFKEEIGMSFNAFVEQTRIETARNILILTSFPIVEISGALHFASQSFFTQVFKKHTGFTPAQYRRRFGRVS